jgi:hypothetical protein
MLTYLHHSDPTIPHYRAGEWNWLRGALATVDRPVLGCIGRFFFHNVSVEDFADTCGLQTQSHRCHMIMLRTISS